MRRGLLILFILLAVTQAAVTRLYIGETEGQAMAGLDARVNFWIFFVGGDVKTVIHKIVAGNENKVMSFIPDRTNYKTLCGLSIGAWEIEYAHTCYHRVIANTNIAFYEGTVNPGDTDSLAVKYFF